MMNVYECRYGSGVVEWVVAQFESEVLPVLIETHGPLDEEPKIRMLSDDECRNQHVYDGAEMTTLWNELETYHGRPHLLSSTEE